jgi:tetratricopeptide (TPR) repeat protein
MSCVDDITIVAYFRGELGASKRAAIEDELDRCESCRELMMVVASAWRADDGALGDTRRAGMTVGRYVIDRVLGAGAMGVVYAARDPELDREIALKVMARPSPELAERFRREAQAMARLDHRNVVSVYDVGGDGPEAFVAMALIRGVTLREWLRAPRTLPHIAEALAQAAEGLAAAHERGIVHRDFKPENVLVGDDGVVRVGDFGLAQLGAPSAFAAASPTTATLAGSGTGLVGTPAYLAPEVRAGGASGPAADQYSFWVTVHEAVTGARPNGGAASVGPRRLARALARGLADDPDARFPSMAAVAAELRAVEGTRRRRAVAIGAVAAVVIIGFGAGAIAWHARGGTASCDDAAAALDAVWPPARAAELRAAIARAPRPYAAFTARAVTDRLERYADAWRASAAAACRATHVEHTQSAELLDRRVSCLAGRLAKLAAAVERVETSNGVSDAVDLVTALPAVEVCDDVQTLTREPVPPQDPVTIQRLAAVRTLIARAKTHFAAGTFQQGVAVARDAVAAARAIGYRPLIAEALEAYGGLVFSSGKDDEALAILEDGLREAEASQAVYPALAIRWREARVLGTLGKHEEALRVARLGLATAESVRSATITADFDIEIGVIESDLGHYEAALDAFRKGLAIYEREQGPDGVETGHVVGLIGVIEDHLGHHDDAVRDLQRALEVEGRVYGKAHPNYANKLSNVAASLSNTDPKRALALAEQAHAIRIAALDPDHPELAMSWSNLGALKRMVGELPEARDDLVKALAIKVRVLGPDNPSVGVTHVTLSQVLFDLHDLPGALDHAQRAVAILAPSLGDAHEYTAAAHARLGTTLLALDRAAEALAPLEAAVAHLDESARYREQLNLAEALASTHGDPARSHALAATALAAATQHGDKLLIAAARKFLQNH